MNFLNFLRRKNKKNKNNKSFSATKSVPLMLATDPVGDSSTYSSYSPLVAVAYDGQFLKFCIHCGTDIEFSRLKVKLKN